MIARVVVNPSTIRSRSWRPPYSNIWHYFFGITYISTLCKWTLEKTEVSIKNGKSKHTWQYWAQDTRWRQTKLKTKKDEQHGPRKNGLKPGAREGKEVPVSYRVPVVLPMLKFGNGLVRDRGKKKLVEWEKIHFHSRLPCFEIETRS
jgi:hypothetical protein